MAPASPRHRRHRRNFNESGHAHELTWSCYHRIPLLREELACCWLIDAIEHARQALQFDVWAWVFMPDHVHLIVHPRLPRYDIASIRRLIKEPVSRKALALIREHHPEWLAKVERTRGKRKEHLFWQSGGGYDRNIDEGGTLLRMIDYIHENPCRKGLVDRAGDWKWSSAAWYLWGKTSMLIPDPIPPAWLAEEKLGP